MSDTPPNFGVQYEGGLSPGTAGGGSLHPHLLHPSLVDTVQGAVPQLAHQLRGGTGGGTEITPRVSPGGAIQPLPVPLPSQCSQLPSPVQAPRSPASANALWRSGPPDSWGAGGWGVRGGPQGPGGIPGGLCRSWGGLRGHWGSLGEWGGPGGSTAHWGGGCWGGPGGFWGVPGVALRVLGGPWRVFGSLGVG